MKVQKKKINAIHYANIMFLMRILSLNKLQTSETFYQCMRQNTLSHIL